MKPINMKKWEIDALLDGRKTTARRLIRPQPDSAPSQMDKKPYLPGDILWVRENIKMPKKDARIFLQVTAVHGEHLQDIDSEGVLREGVQSKKPEWLKVDFADLWNGALKPADLDIFEWWKNPWVWVIEFEQIGQKMTIEQIIIERKRHEVYGKSTGQRPEISG